ncbi:MAG: hypothetical protein D6806_16395 [Deltaproteobacteria bacterium]|nr:MAG: hypothetical protein D6806_16395 [Deltaproteobacteria bacterium]
MSGENQSQAQKARRKTFLIDKSFQLKYTLLLVAVGVAVSAVLGYLIYDLTQETYKLMELDRAMEGEVAKFDARMLYFLGGFVVVMAVFLFAWGIVITHRVAGPVYIISRYLGQLRDGEMPQMRPLRRGDELKGFFAAFTEMVSSMKQRAAEEAGLLEQAARLLEKSEDQQAAELAGKLKKLAGHKRSQSEG